MPDSRSHDWSRDDPGERSHRNQRRALSFGAIAEAYDELRPGYPSAVIDAELAAAAGRLGVAAEAPLRILDIGTGTGILARDLTARGHSVLGLDPDEAMLEVARAQGTEVVIARFEDWVESGAGGLLGSFDVLFAAQCWHWLDPARASAGAAALLRPGGSLVLLWNYPVEFADPPQADVLAGYQRHAPALIQSSVITGNGAAVSALHADQLRRQGDFSQVRPHEFSWLREFTGAQWVQLISTFSDHSQLPEHLREPLLADIAAAISATGDDYRVRFETFVVTASGPVGAEAS